LNLEKVYKIIIDCIKLICFTIIIILHDIIMVDLYLMEYKLQGHKYHSEVFCINH